MISWIVLVRARIVEKSLRSQLGRPLSSGLLIYSSLNAAQLVGLIARKIKIAKRMKTLPRRYKYRLIFAMSTAMVYVIKALEIDVSGFIIGGIFTFGYMIWDKRILKGDKRDENH